MSKKVSVVSSSKEVGAPLVSSIINKRTFSIILLGVVLWSLVPPFFFETITGRFVAAYWCLALVPIVLIVPSFFKGERRNDMFLPFLVCAYFSSITELHALSIVTIIFSIMAFFSFVNTVVFISTQLQVASIAERFAHRHDVDYVFESLRKKDKKSSASSTDDDIGLVSLADANSDTASIPLFKGDTDRL